MQIRSSAPHVKKKIPRGMIILREWEVPYAMIHSEFQN